MKYYIKNNKVESFFTEGAVEIESPVREDGTILPKHKNLNLCEVDEDGSHHEFYLIEAVDGKYVKNEKKIQEKADKVEAKATKDGKDLALENLVVSTNKVPFDANAQSINYMSSVIAVASAEYCKVISEGLSPTIAYNNIFKTKVDWRNANNTNSEVELETVKEALQKAMFAVGSIKTGA